MLETQTTGLEGIVEQKPAITLTTRELADTYALRTLYDCLKEEEFDADLFFREQDLGPRCREIITGCPIIDPYCPRNIHANICVYSDLSRTARRGNTNLEIDISILKNCAKPTTPEEKEQLRKKYDVPSDKPVLVIGYASSGLSVDTLIEALAAHTHIYTIGSLSRTTLPRLPEDAHVECVTRVGVLKDYYALADVAVNAENLFANGNQLHNFIEATAGGPLFMIPLMAPPQQYGYKELVQKKVIRESQTLEKLIQKIKQYISSPNPEKYQRTRNNHLQETRHTYIPLIIEYLDYLLGRRHFPPRSHLHVEKGSTTLRITHPDTDWRTLFEDQPAEAPKKKKITQNIPAKEQFDKKIHSLPDAIEQLKYIFGIYENKTHEEVQAISGASADWQSYPCAKQEFIDKPWLSLPPKSKTDPTVQEIKGPLKKLEALYADLKLRQPRQPLVLTPSTYPLNYTLSIGPTKERTLKNIITYLQTLTNTHKEIELFENSLSYNYPLYSQNKILKF